LQQTPHIRTWPLHAFFAVTLCVLCHMVRNTSSICTVKHKHHWTCLVMIARCAPLSCCSPSFCAAGSMRMNRLYVSCDRHAHPHPTARVLPPSPPNTSACPVNTYKATLPYFYPNPPEYQCKPCPANSARTLLDNSSPYACTCTVPGEGWRSFSNGPSCGACVCGGGTGVGAAGMCCCTHVFALSAARRPCKQAGQQSGKGTALLLPYLLEAAANQSMHHHALPHDHLVDGHLCFRSPVPRQCDLNRARHVRVQGWVHVSGSVLPRVHGCGPPGS
jgi:hypothetical protein